MFDLLDIIFNTPSYTITFIVVCISLVCVFLNTVPDSAKFEREAEKRRKRDREYAEHNYLGWLLAEDWAMSDAPMHTETELNIHYANKLRRTLGKPVSLSASPL